MKTADDLRKRIEAFPYWYHHIELPYGLFTPGWSPIEPDAYRIPDVRGKRVLDVGAWDGYWTFEALKRGAREVVAIDDFSDYMGKLAKDDRKAWETFDLCRSVLGFSEERCKRIEMSLYDISEENLGCFDIVFLFGVLYHQRHPLLALDKIAAICGEQLCVESAILDHYSPYQGGLGHGYPGHQMVMEFYPDNQYGDNPSNWWVPTLFCLMNMMKAAGFAYVEGWKFEQPTDLPYCRGFAQGRKHPPEEPAVQVG